MWLIVVSIGYSYTRQNQVSMRFPKKFYQIEKFALGQAPSKFSTFQRSIIIERLYACTYQLHRLVTEKVSSTNLFDYPVYQT